MNPFWINVKNSKVKNCINNVVVPMHAAHAEHACIHNNNILHTYLYLWQYNRTSVIV